MKFLENLPSGIKHIIALIIGSILLLYALGIFRTQLQIIVIIVACLLILKALIGLGLMSKIMRLFCTKNNCDDDSSSKKENDRSNDPF